MNDSNPSLVEEDRQSVAMPEELQHLAERERVQGLALQRMFAEQEHGLRQSYADWIIRVLGAQLFVADLVFVALAWAGWNWELSAGVIESGSRRRWFRSSGSSRS